MSPDVVGCGSASGMMSVLQILIAKQSIAKSGATSRQKGPMTAALDLFALK